MDTNKLHLFVTAAKTGNLTHAAEQLGYTQSGASHMLKSLEKELGGAALFYRNRGGLELTPAGKRLLSPAQEVLHWESQLVQTARTTTEGKPNDLRIAGIVSCLTPWLPPIMNRFSKLYPEINIQILQSCYDDIEEWVLTRQADCAFSRIPVSQKSLEAVFLKSDPLLAVLPVSHPLAERKSLTYQDLNGQAFIRTIGDRYSDIAPIIEHPSLSLRYPYVMHTYGAALEKVSLGYGISIMPELVIRHYRMPGICIRPFEESPVRNIGLVTRASQTSPVVASFSRIVLQLLQEGLLN